MRRSDQRRDAVFALYQHEVTGRPLESCSWTPSRSPELAEEVEGKRAELDESSPDTRRAGRWSGSRRSSAASCGPLSTRPSTARRAGRGGDRRGGRAGQGVLRRRRARVRQRHPRRGAGGARRRRLMAPALEGVEGLLLDLSGVIYVQEEAVPGSGGGARALPGRRVSDPARHQHDDAPAPPILERLERLGIGADPMSCSPRRPWPRAAVRRRATSRSPWSCSTSSARTWRASRSEATPWTP